MAQVPTEKQFQSWRDTICRGEIHLAKVRSKCCQDHQLNQAIRDSRECLSAFLDEMGQTIEEIRSQKLVFENCGCVTEALKLAEGLAETLLVQVTANSSTPGWIGALFVALENLYLVRRPPNHFRKPGML